jgi:DNA modification methylase
MQAELRRNGVIRPPLVDENDTIVAGHAVVAAAKQNGLTRIPVIRVKGLTPEQILAYSIADNRLAEDSHWNDELVLVNIEKLNAAGLDPTASGFELPEIELLQLENDRKFIDEDALPIVRRPISRRGDLWKVGKHLILCGDARSVADFRRLLGTEKAQMVFGDPPFNVRIRKNVSGLGKNRHREFVCASGEMSQSDYTQFLEDVFVNQARFSIPGAVHFTCMDWRHQLEIATAGRVFSSLLNVCVWVKNNGGMGSLYRSQYELIYVFKSGKAPHVNNIELGRHGRNRTNVWEYAGVNSFGAKRDAELAMHPTVKPVEMVADAILDCSHRDGLILDPFGGSGSTAVAAESVGRRSRLMELDPIYVDTAVLRCERAFKCEAVLEGDGRTFKEVQRERQQASSEAAEAPVSIKETA